MLITGEITRQNVSNSKIYLLDIRNYTWVDRFEVENIVDKIPSNTTSKASTTLPVSTITIASKNQSDVNNQLKTMKIVIGVLGGIVIITIGFFGYKWYKRYQEKIREWNQFNR